MSWTGNCIDSLPNGNGLLTIKYESEEVLRYNGHMSEGKFDGLGNYKYGMSELKGYFMDGTFFSSDSGTWTRYKAEKIEQIYLNFLL